MNDLLTVRSLAVSFAVAGGMVDAVRGVSFRVPQGGTVAIVGESGSGKSVVSQAIMGILPRSAILRDGQILFADPKRPGNVVDIARLKQRGRVMRAIRGARVSIIFQEPMTSLSPLHTVGDQVGEAYRLHHRGSSAQAREMTRDMLRLVDFPDPDRALKTYPFELSGGLRQRAMIAMALICRPALLIADEPTTALDVTIQAQILELIRDLQRELGMALLLITHDLGVVANMAEEIVVMYHGKVMECGSREDIFRSPTHPYLRALLRAVPRFHMAPGERLVPIREITPTTGHLMAEKDPWPEDADLSGPLLWVNNLAKRFHIRKSGWLNNAGGAEIHALDNVSLEIRRGESLGLVGESGCGKTTLARVIMRALTPDSGNIWFNDRGRLVDLVTLNQGELTGYRRRIQYIFQDPFGSLNPRMTVFDIINEPLLIHRIGNAATRAEMVEELMQLVGLDPRYLKRYPHSFSGGQRQRIGIARALALKPDLLICDEPVSALDVSVQAQVLNLLKDLQEKLGLTFLFISHNLAVVDYVADRIAVMCAGRVVEIAPSGTLWRQPKHPYTRTLLAAVPEPDPDYPLDFAALAAGRASDPAQWPAPFTIDGIHHPPLLELGGDHWVRASEAPPETEAAA